MEMPKNLLPQQSFMCPKMFSSNPRNITCIYRNELMRHVVGLEFAEEFVTYPHEDILNPGLEMDTFSYMSILMSCSLMTLCTLI